MAEDEPKDRPWSRGAEDAEHAQWLAVELKHEYRYDHTTHRWHRWNGIRWAPDQTMQLQNRVIELARERVLTLIQTTDPSKSRDETEKVYRKLWEINNVESAVKALGLLDDYKTDGADWDADPFLLGCDNGIVDLRTGELDKHPDPSCLVTRTTGIKYDPEAQAPRFVSFLQEITSHDAAQADFLMTWFGYSLFGISPEQRFLIMVGGGANGKGALSRIMRHVFGEYVAPADSNVYMKSKYGHVGSDRPRADLMALKGKRLALMSEPDGGAFNEEMLKAHTGGDPIVARALNSNNVLTWEPTHSISFLTNKAPTTEDIGTSMARRVMVAEFWEKFEGVNEDKNLDKKLSNESPGILNLLIRFAGFWYDQWASGNGGLVVPPRVLKASENYINSNDPIGPPLEEAFVLEKGVWTPSKHLHDAYLEWFARSDRDDDPLTLTAWAQALKRRGLRSKRTSQGVFWGGIRAKTAMETADDDAD